MKTKKTIVKLVKLILLVAGFILIVFSFFQLFRSDFFKINQVICFDSLDKDNPCQADLWLRVNSLVLGKNIIFLSPQQLEQRVQSEIPEIDQVKIEKKLPSKIILYLSKKKAIAVIEVQNKYYEVDYQGTVLARLDQPTGLPLVVCKDPSVIINNHQVESPPILGSLNCLYHLLFKNIEVRRVEIIKANELLFDFKNGAKALIIFDKDCQRQVDSLQLILERAKIEGARIEQVDLRFDKPVVTYY